MPQHIYRNKDRHLIENYELAKKDNFKGWCIHHRLEFDLEGNEVHTPASLKKLGMYYRRPYFELIYMTRHEHQILHNKAKKGKFTEERRRKISESLSGRHLSTEHCRKMSELFKGENNPFYGKHHSEETRKKMSESHKGKVPWNKGKHLSSNN